MHVPTNKTYSIGQTANLVAGPTNTLPVTTIRNWAKAFASHLSPGANPDRGVERRFDDRDIAVLRLVAQLRSDRILWADIEQRLSETTITAHEVIADSAPVPTEPVPTPTEPPTTALATISVVNDLDVRLRAVESRQAAQTWRSTPALWLAVGVTLGVILGAVVVVMALQLVK